MKQFQSIEKIDTSILYVLELTSSLSVLLLAFGLIASMANVLTKGSVLSDNIIMQRVWAWTQCIAIDASVAGTIIRTFRSYAERHYVKTVLHGFLSVLLLFTAAIVSNIESVQQTLNLTLDNAYRHVFVSVEALIWIRSLAVVLLIVAHALRHVQPEPKPAIPPITPSATSLALTPELIDALQAVLRHVAVTEEQQPLLVAQSEQETNTQEVTTEHEANKDEQPEQESEHEASNYDRVRAYLAAHQKATDRDIADALAISVSTANKWKKRSTRGASTSEHAEQE